MIAYTPNVSDVIGATNPTGNTTQGAALAAGRAAGYSDTQLANSQQFGNPDSGFSASGLNTSGFTGAYEYQGNDVNGGALTYRAYVNGELVDSQIVSPTADQTALNSRYLGSSDKSGYGPIGAPGAGALSTAGGLGATGSHSELPGLGGAWTPGGNGTPNPNPGETGGKIGPGHVTTGSGTGGTISGTPTGSTGTAGNSGTGSISSTTSLSLGSGLLNGLSATHLLILGVAVIALLFISRKVL